MSYVAQQSFMSPQIGVHCRHPFAHPKCAGVAVHLTLSRSGEVNQIHPFTW